MRKSLLVLGLVFLFSTSVMAQFTFYLIDNFEDENYTDSPKWWRFGDLKLEIVRNPSSEARDLIAESCGDYSLSLSGVTNNWYVGGMGTDILVDASRFSRFQVDVFGNKEFSGKLKIEVFDDDNQNYTLEQDPQNSYMPIYDDKWVAEVNILGEGFTRTSIPFTAFRDVNPGVGDDIWNPDQNEGSGGLLKMQMVCITEKRDDVMSFRIDNLLLTY